MADDERHPTGAATMATKTKTTGVICPFCLDPDASLSLELNDLGVVTCTCGENFTPAEALAKVNEMASRWAAVVAWVANAPVV